MKKLWLRLKGETPIFFKRIQMIGGSLIAIRATIEGIGSLPEYITSIGNHAAVIGATMIVVSQFAVTNISILQGKQDNDVVNVNTPSTQPSGQTVTPTN